MKQVVAKLVMQGNFWLPSIFRFLPIKWVHLVVPSPFGTTAEIQTSHLVRGLETRNVRKPLEIIPLLILGGTPDAEII